MREGDKTKKEPAALKEPKISEKVCSRLLEMSREGVLILDAQTGQILEINPFMTELLGYSRKEFLGKKIWNIGVFKDIVKNKAAFAKLQQKKEIRYENLPLETKDGRPIQVEFISSVYSVDRKKKLIQCHIRDITERKQWENILRESEERYHRAFETSRDGLLLLDKRTGNIVNTNPSAQKMLGYSHKDFLGKSLKNVGVLKDIEDFKKDLKKLEESEHISYDNVPITTKKGNRIDADIYLIDKAKVFQCNIRDVTERKQMEDLLLKEKEFSDSIINTAQTIILVLDTKGCIVHFNPYMEKVSGYRLEEVKGRNWFETFLPEEIRVNIRELFLRAINDIHTIGNVNALLTKEGRTLQIEWYDKTLKDANNNTVGLLSIGQDITDRVRAEELLRESEEFYSALVSGLPDVVLVHKAGTMVYVNRAAESVLGYSLEESIGSNILDYVVEEDKQKIIDAIKRRMSGEDVRDYEIRVITKSGQIIDVLVRAQIVPYKGEQAFLVILIDITERKRVEETIKQQLREIASYYDNAPIGLAVIDTDLRFLRINRILADINGISVDEHIGKTIRDIVPDLESQVKELTSEILRTGKAVTNIEFTGETEAQPGITRTWLENWHPFMKDSQEIIGFMVTVQEITEKKKAEDALCKSENQLANAVAIAHLGPWEYDVENDVFTFSDSFYAIFRTTAEQVGGYTMSSAEYAKRFVHPGDVAVVGEETRKAIETDDPNFSRELEHRIIYSNGETGYITIRFFVVKDENGKTVRTYGVNQDITKRKKAENAVQESEKRLRELADMLPQTIFETDATGRFLFNNRGALDMFGYTQQDVDKGMNVLQAIDPPDHERAMESMKMVMKGKPSTGNDYTMIRKDGSTFPAIIYSSPIIKDGKPVGLRGIAIDITERKNAEERERQALQDMEFLAQTATSFVELSPDEDIYQCIGRHLKTFFGKDVIIIVTSYDKASQKNIPQSFFGLDELSAPALKVLEKELEGVDFKIDEKGRQGLISGKLTKLLGGIYELAFGALPKQTSEALEKFLEVSEIYSMGLVRKRNLLGSVSIIMRKGSSLQNRSTVEALINQASMALQRKHTDDQIKASLMEKNLLLKEIHHRVKNNMQIINSLLSLQSQYITDKKALDSFQETRNRVLAMALVHEELYGSKDLSSIPLPHYIESMSKYLFETYNVSPGMATIKTSIEDVHLGIDMAVPCGLLISELISNSLKHAFPDGRKGEIVIDLHQDKDSTLQLMVKDNGVGMSQGVNLDNPDTFGIMLVKILAGQLDASVAFEREGGTTVKIAFKVKEQPDRMTHSI